MSSQSAAKPLPLFTTTELSENLKLIIARNQFAIGKLGRDRAQTLADGFPGTMNVIGNPESTLEDIFTKLTSEYRKAYPKTPDSDLHNLCVMIVTALRKNSLS